MKELEELSIGITSHLFLSSSAAADSSDEEEDRKVNAIIPAPPRATRHAQGTGVIVVGDSVQNRFTVLYFPEVQVKKDGKSMLVGLLQIHHVVPLASDHTLNSMILDRDGYGVTWNFPVVPSLHTRVGLDVRTMAQSIHSSLDFRGRAYVSVDQLHMNLLANFRYLQTEAAAQPDVLMGSKYFRFVSDTGESLRCSLEHFNSDNVNFEVETHVSTHETTIVTRPDGSVITQPIYLLSWNLCVAKTARVVLESSVSSVDRLFEAISLNPSRANNDSAMNGGI
jgi:hypothetical protein